MPKPTEFQEASPQGFVSRAHKTSCSAPGDCGEAWYSTAEISGAPAMDAENTLRSMVEILARNTLPLRFHGWVPPCPSGSPRGVVSWLATGSKYSEGVQCKRWVLRRDM